MTSITFFRDYAARSRRERDLTVPALAELIRTTSAPAKDHLPWLKLARFGNAVTMHGSLRHDRNVIAVGGVEADYDGEKVGFDAAVETAEKAGLRALLYTSPSHVPDRPRWRALCPFGREHPPVARKHFLARLNGLFGGVFAHESWTLSQAYYFGSVNHSPAHRAEVIDGAPLDEMDELDAIAIGKPEPIRGQAQEGSADGARADAEMIRRVITGAGYHTELCSLAARYLGRGLDTRAAGDVLRGIMLARPEDARDERWRDRFDSIRFIVASAAAKFASGSDKRRAIARRVHALIRAGQSGATIKQHVIAEAERLGIPEASALAIAGAILNDTHGRGHV